jgi:YD repeat-containing protein
MPSGDSEYQIFSPLDQMCDATTGDCQVVSTVVNNGTSTMTFMNGSDLITLEPGDSFQLYSQAEIAQFMDTQLRILPEPVAVAVDALPLLPANIIVRAPAIPLSTDYPVVPYPMGNPDGRELQGGVPDQDTVSSIYNVGSTFSWAFNFGAATRLGLDRTKNAIFSNDPVDTFSGSFHIREQDIVIPGGAFDLVLTRTYDSRALYAGPLGWNWDHNHNQYIREIGPDGGPPTSYGRWTGELHEDVFYTIDGGFYIPPSGVCDLFEIHPPLRPSVLYMITRPGGLQFCYTSRDTIRTNRVVLDDIYDRFGNHLHYSYDSEFNLEWVQDVTSGRKLTFILGNCGMLEKIVDDHANVWQYFHDPDIQHLVAMQHPPTPDYGDGFATQYLYSDDLLSDPFLAHCIVAVTDGDGNTYIQNEYDPDPSNYSYGKVIAQISDAFAYQYAYTQIQFAPQIASLWMLQTSVTEVQMPDGGVRAYTFNYRGDLLEERLRLVTDGSYNVLVTSYTYDYYGNLISITYPENSGGFTQAVLSFTYNTPIAPLPPSPYPTPIPTAAPPPDVRTWSLLTSVSLKSSVSSDTLLLWSGIYDEPSQLLTHSYDQYPPDATVSDFLTQFSYDSQGFLNLITYPVVHRPDGTIQAATVSLAHSLVVPGRVDTISSALTSRAIQYTYDNIGAHEAYKRLIQISVDPTGINSTTELNYATPNFGSPNSVTDPTGIQKQFVFNSQYKLVSIVLSTVDGLTGAISLHYDSDGFLTDVDTPKGAYTDGTITGNSIKTLIERDIHREIHTVTSGVNTASPRVSVRTVDYRGLDVEIVDPELHIIDRVFDERGLLLSVQARGTDGLKSPMTRYTYDNLGNPLTSYDAGVNGIGAPYNLTTNNYDGFSRLIRTTDCNGNYTEFSYYWADAAPVSAPTYGIQFNNPLVQIDSCDAGDLVHARTIREYDKRGRLIEVRVAEFTDPVLKPALSLTYRTTQYNYDADNNLVKLVGPRGETTTYTYDLANRLTEVLDPLGNARLYFYDAAGRIISMQVKDVNSDYLSLTWKFTYDARGRLSTTVTPEGAGSGITSKFKYDDRDLCNEQILPPTIVDPVERSLLQSFGILGELLTSTSALGLVSRWTYDKSNQVVSFEDPSSAITNYSYDSLGRPIGASYPGGALTAQTYDAHGRPYQNTSHGDTVTTSTYLENGLLNAVAITPGSMLQPVPTHNYTYDALNRQLTATAGTSIISNSYDSLSRVLSESTSTTNITQLYDTLAGTIARGWHGGRVETFSFDLNGEPTTIVWNGAGSLGVPPVTNLFSLVTMNGPDLIDTATQYNASIGIQTKYDMQKRLYELDYTSASDNETLLYRYDGRQRRRAGAVLSTHWAPSDNYALYLQDNDDHITNTSGTPTLGGVMMTTINTQTDHDTDVQTNIVPSEPGIPQIGYGYYNTDARETYVNNSVSFSSSYIENADHTLQHSALDIFTYVADGTRKTDGTRHYDVDGLGRITKIYDSGGTQTLAISYDALGRPCLLDDGVHPPRSLEYFGLDLLQESVGGAAVRQYTVHPTLGRIATQVLGDSFQHLYDAGQNLIATLDSTGAVRDIFRYDDFGFPTNYGMSPSGIEPVFGGMRYLDIPGTGSAPIPNWPSGPYLGMYRLYDPSNGVWMSQDPIGYAGGGNMSAYVGQSPMNAIDPLGLRKSATVEVGDITYHTNHLNTVSGGATATANPGSVLQGMGHGVRDAFDHQLYSAIEVFVDPQAFQHLPETVLKTAKTSVSTARDMLGFAANLFTQKGSFEDVITISSFIEGYNALSPFHKGYFTGQVATQLAAGVIATKGVGLAESAFDLAMFEPAPLTSIFKNANYVEFKRFGMTRITRSGAASDFEHLRFVATRAESEVGGVGKQAGSLKHSFASKYVEAHERIYGQIELKLSTEPTYLDRTFRGRFRPLSGSVRPDIVGGPVEHPLTVYDFKFSNDPNYGFDPGWMRKYWLNMPKASPAPIAIFPF